MNAPERFFLPDIQASADQRQLAIHKVGVRGLRYPLALLDASGKVQNTVAQLSMSVGLPPEQKGTHMSRFVELLEQKRAPLNVNRLLRMLDEMLLRLDARERRDRTGLSLLHQQGGAGVGRREPARLRRADDRRETRGAAQRADAGGRRPGDQPVPVLQGDQRLRRAQPALAHHDQRSPAFGHVARGTAAAGRGGSLVRSLRTAQASRTRNG
jgi:hypothetical protein